MTDRGMIGRIIDHYRIETMLGQGGMAAVYQATDLQLEREVAIKVMHPHLASQASFQQRFLQEARAAARLDHPSIIRVFSFDSTGSDLFIVMELIPGGNLRQYLKRLRDESREVDYQEAIEVTRQMADALDYAHQQGMIHRDIKPDNVLLKADSESPRLNYRAILTDFGLARLTTGDENAITDQQPIGTYPYMSPEQSMADELDARSDIYSLGIMLYEVAVGRLPYNPKTIFEAAKMHRHDALTLPSALRSDFPPDLEEIIIRCLSKNREDRYSTAGELAKALRALQKPVQPTARIEVKPSAPLRPPPAPSPDEGIATDLTTAVMPEPLPLELPSLAAPERTSSDYDRLLFYHPENPVFAFDLAAEVVIIGRDANREIVLPSESVSRRHVQIERKPNGKYYITDLRSANGLWLGDKQLSPGSPVILNPGMTVRLGEYWMLLELKPLLPEAEAPVETDDPIRDVETIVKKRAGRLENVLDDLIGDPETDDIPTQPMSQAAINREMPRHTPPHVTADQIGYDRLIFYSESNPTVTARLDKERMTIGRASRQDIVLPANTVSRHHARVDLAADGKHYIVDVGSISGTWIDGKRIEPNTSVRLDEDHVVRIGDYWMQFEAKRDVPLPLQPLEGEEIELQADPNQTAVMVKPLSEELPQYSPPPLSVDMRASDRLVFFSEDHPMQIIKLDKEAFSIGRAPGQDVLLEGKRVSRQHAQIEIKTDGNIYVTDLNSANGVWMGDTLLVPSTSVLWDTKEIIRLGNYWIKFEQGTRDFDPFAASGGQEKWGRVGKKIKNYRIDRFVGQSDLAAVYKATQLPLNRPVALKILHPNLAAQEMLKQRFLREARQLSRLDHPNIVKVHTADNADNELFMVMDFVSPFNLRNHLKKFKEQDRRMEQEEALGLIIQIADGLHYAHQQGMIHRDMTPESIVLREQARVGPVVKYQPVLTDFTVAQASDSGEIFATDKPQVNYPYMSPEQCLGERVDVRSDIYELGVVLYEVVVGQPPYQPRSIAEAIRMHAREPIPRPTDIHADIPDELEKIALKALEKNPNNRYQTAGELARALRRISPERAVDGDSPAVIGAAPGLAVEDNQVTVVLLTQPKEMPLPTRTPDVEGSEHDRLVIYSDDQQTQVIELKQDIYTIGRDPDQDIKLNSDKITRRHAKLERGIGGVYRLTDLGSRNGSWVGNYRLVGNVAEVWEISETVRVGNFWMRIEPAYDPDAELLPQSGDQGAPQEAAPARPVIVIPTPEQEKIGVVIQTPHVRVAPGSSITLPVEVVNRGDVVDHFRVEAIGLPGRWITQPTEPLYLLPHSRDTTSITFHPPLESNSAAGAHAYEVRVIARAQGTTSTATQGSLTIEPFNGFTTDMQPERLRGRGRVELTITNTGNMHQTFSITARDREQVVAFDLEGQQYVLPPGYTEYVSIRVRPKKRPLLGAPQTHPFEISVSPLPADKGIPPRSENGEVVALPRLRGWMIGGCVVLLLLIALVAIIIGLQVAQNYTQTQTVTAVAMATGLSANATGTAESDVDADSLSFSREAEVGSDPKLIDTDEDGLNDGEEVRVWLTNPLNRDTDGDELSDGDEVKNGTDPNKRDTDGDGIQDNVDINPIALPTATITPYPTIPGSSGDICPGSPAPSVMKIGIQGVVTEGGVANRLRDKPSKKDGQIINYMAPGSTFVVVDGPVCDAEDQLRWWQVNFNGQVGWTAEGEKQDFYLAPAEATQEASAGESTDGSIQSPPKVVAKLDHARMGVQVDWNLSQGDWNQVMDMVNPMQVGWVKIQASWRGLEPEQGQLGGDAPRLQLLLEDAHKRGYRVLISIAKAPDWARADHSADGPPDDPAELGRFLTLFLAQMGANIDAIEVWNEPNLRIEWTGSLAFSGQGYMDLFRPAYEAIRAFSPSMPIITAGLAPTIDGDGSVNDRRFLRQMYQAGLADLKDVAVGIHPYSWGNPPDMRCCDAVEGRGWDDKPQFFFLNNLDTYRGIMRENGHAASQVWVTEFGWASWDGFASSPPEAWMGYNTAQDQADYTLRAFGIGQALDFVAAMFLWNLNFANATTVAAPNQVAGYSLLLMDGGSVRPRPIYDTFIRQRQS